MTQRIRFLVAVRPGFISLGLFAQMAAALHQISRGRLDINIVPGGIQNDLERLGEVSDHDIRYERAEEFIAACRKLWREPGAVTYHGVHYRLEGAFCSPAPGEDAPLFYLRGVSQRAMTLSGRQADVHLAWIEPLEDTARRLEDLRHHYRAAGRIPSFGLRTHLVIGDTEEQAWHTAEELIKHADPVVKAQRRSAIEGTPMVGQQAQAREAPDTGWGRTCGTVSEVRVNCGTAIVGTPQQVAEELLAYWKLGIDKFILSGFPHVEECRRVAGEVLPCCENDSRRAGGLGPISSPRRGSTGRA